MEKTESFSSSWFVLGTNLVDMQAGGFVRMNCELNHRHCRPSARLLSAMKCLTL